MNEQFIVEIQWSTDFDGRVIDPTVEEYARTLHGPFPDQTSAQRWLEDYPEDTDIAEMLVIMLNDPAQI